MMFFSLQLHPDWIWDPPNILTNGYWRLLPWGLKWLEHEVDHTLPPRTMVKNVWSYTSTHPIHLYDVVLN